MQEEEWHRIRREGRQIDEGERMSRGGRIREGNADWQVHGTRLAASIDTSRVIVSPEEV